MRNIWNSHKRVSISMLLSIAVYMCVIVFVVVGIMSISKNSKSKEVEEITKQINKSISLCYAIEGFYPPNLEYLEENYGIDVNKEEYVVHYEIFASNIAPQIKVFEIK